MAVAAHRTAALDLQAKLESKPLTALLGAAPGPVAGGAVVARFGDLAATLGEAQERVSDGYQKIKVKIGPGFDVAPVLALRDALPGVLIAADANGSYGQTEVPPEIDQAGLAYLEQPYPAHADWKALAELRNRLNTPICLDESITGPPTLRSGIAAGACDLVNLKAPRYAGLAQAIELHDIARSAGIGLVAGGLLETGIGRAAALALARLPGFTVPADLSASNRYWERDLVEPAWELENGALVVPDAPGIGVEVDEEFLESVTISRHSLPG
jgi:O-succinylbenzoate synthase